MFWIKEMGKYAGSMRTRALSGAETIHVNGKVLEYLIQGNQHGYCAVHTPQCRTYGTMPYAVWNMPYGSTHPLYCFLALRHRLLLLFKVYPTVSVFILWSGGVEVSKNLVSLQGELSWVTRPVNDHEHGVALRAINGFPLGDGLVICRNLK